MTGQLVAGAPVVYPGRLDGAGPLHLGRTEARKDRDPAVIGLCPPVRGRELERGIEAPRRRWWQLRRRGRLDWCPYCATLRDQLHDMARKNGKL